MKKTLYIQKNGILKMKNTTLYFISKEEKQEIPIERIDSIYFIGSGSISTGVLKKLSKNGVVLHIFGKYGQYVGSFFPKKQLISGELIVRQVEAFLNKEKRLSFAKKFVEGAASSIKWVIRKHNLSKIENIDLGGENSIAELMQKEGLFRKKFYKVIDEKISDEFKIQRRDIRPPSNKGNAILSFLNSLVYARVASEIYHTHLHPAVSYLHEPFERRISLSLDVSEIFKPILSEKIFLKMVNLKMLDPEIDFVDDKGVFLSPIGRDKILRTFEEEIKKTVRMRKSNKKRTIQELIRVELYKIEKDLLKIKKYTPLKPWW